MFSRFDRIVACDGRVDEACDGIVCNRNDFVFCLDDNVANVYVYVLLWQLTYLLMIACICKI